MEDKKVLDRGRIWDIIIFTLKLSLIKEAVMPKRTGNRKQEALREQRTLNPHPERVVDRLFLEHDFFDPCDLLQVKYEMLRRVRLEGRSLSESARAFGFSRPSFYKARSAFEAGGLSGLLPRRRGPKGRHKLRREVMDFLEREMASDPSLRGRALSQRVEERFGLRVHPRSIERALARRQKKRKQRRRAGHWRKPGGSTRR